MAHLVQLIQEDQALIEGYCYYDQGVVKTTNNVEVIYSLAKRSLHSFAHLFNYSEVENYILLTIN